MSLEFVLQIAVAFAGAYVVIIWVGLVIWTFRDIRSRTDDSLVQVGSAILVGIFNLAGLILYLLLRPRQTIMEAYERSLEEEALLQDIEQLMVCPKCRQRLEPDFAFCPACHTRLRNVCPICDKALRLEWKICPYCGCENLTESHAGSYFRPST